MPSSRNGIRQRRDGRWEARWRTRDGRRHSLYAQTQREAGLLRSAAVLAADDGVWHVADHPTTGAYLEAWIDRSVRPRLTASTADSYAWITTKYLRPELGRIPLDELAPADVQRAIANLALRSLSPTTVRYALTVLRIALGQAVRDGRIARNAAVITGLPPKVHRAINPLSAAEASAFLDSVRGDRLEALFTTALGLGIRQGELLALRWSDLDLDAGTVTIRNTLRRSTQELAELSNEHSRRTLLLPPFVTASLRRHRSHQAEQHFGGADGYVFASSRGTALMARSVTRSLHAALERAGLPRQRFNDLRHASASLLLERGAGFDTVSRLLGHSNVSTTAIVYSHLVRTRLQAAADGMDAAVGAKRGTGT